LALGGLTLLVGPNRVAASLAQVRAKAQCVVDDVIDDPIALRRQLEQLAEQYPDRIAEVRGEIAEVDHQFGQLTRDIEIATRVVAYTGEDLSVLQNRIARAQEEAASNVRRVYIRFEGVRFDIDEAYTEALRIGNVRRTYNDRLAYDQQQAEMLDQQRSRLTEILNKLEEDFNTYQTQLWTLGRQIDAIGRNDRLIELMEEQQETMASYDRYARVSSLSQIEGKLAELRTIQEAQMDQLSKQGSRNNYEQKAQYDMDRENPMHDAYERLMQDLEEGDDAEPASTPDSIAFAQPIIIDD
jgi:chromosome segregation ATPase